jgi:drug/metabolite transporter (DMT)-like permease
MTFLWIPLAIGAAFLQNVRSALQKYLKDELGVAGATFVRFGYGFPFALIYLLVLVYVCGLPMPELNLRFTIFAFVGALAQIAGTGLLITLFDTRNFAVGTTYSKTETIQAAVFATIFLGETISTAATIGIFISLVGVVTISAAKGPTDLRSLARSWMAKPALIGLASGASFGIAAVGFRGASLSLGGEGFLSQAAYTLTAALAIQTVVMMVAMQLRNPGELKKVARAWKTAVWVGASGAAASVGWFTAMTIQNAALVRALGQIELVFTITASVLIFREKIHRLELIGIFLVVAGILTLLLL